MEACLELQLAAHEDREHLIRVTTGDSNSLLAMIGKPHKSAVDPAASKNESMNEFSNRVKGSRKRFQHIKHTRQQLLFAQRTDSLSRTSEREDYLHFSCLPTLETHEPTSELQTRKTIMIDQRLVGSKDTDQGLPAIGGCVVSQ